MDLLRQEATTFNSDDLLQSLAKANYMLIGGESMNNPNELAILRTMGDDPVFLRIESFWRHRVRERLIIRHELLALMVENLWLPNNKSGQLVMDSLPQFRKCILRMSGFLEKASEGKQPQTKEEETKFMRGSFFRNAYLNATHDFGYLLGRYYSIFFEHLPRCMKAYPGEAYDFVSKFEELKNVNLKVFMVIVFGIWGHYSKQGLPDKLNWLKDPAVFLINRVLDQIRDEKKEESRRVFDLISNTREGFRHELEQLGSLASSQPNYYLLDPIWRKPFYKIADEAYFPLDMAFLQEKMTSGVKWVVHDGIAEKVRTATTTEERENLTRERHRLMAFYGRTLESYVGGLIERTFGDRQRYVVLRDPETAGVDFIVYDRRSPTRLILLEVTASSVRYKQAMSGDWDAILTEIGKIFFRPDDPGAKGKIQQFEDSITLFRFGKLARLREFAEQIKEIYPVLVFETCLPTFGLLAEYKRLITERGLLRDCIGNLQFLDLEELEALEPLVRERDDPLCDLLCTKVTTQWFESPMKNFLMFNRLWMKNRVLGELFKPILEDARAIFKLDEAPKVAEESKIS